MEKFLQTPFTEPYYFFLITGIIFLVTFLRYLFFSGIYHYIFFELLKEKYHRRFILNKKEKKQARLEIIRSVITSIIFAFSGTALIILWQKGYTKIYTNWNDYPLWYLLASLIFALLIHETYYYWLHRWMHQPKIYRIVHKWHHESIDTNSLTSFSFHPIESILQAVVVPLVVLFLPMHISVLFVLLFIMTISGTVNHAGVEVYPKGFHRHWLGKWIVGATHHDLHHKQFRFNYGLYFTFWDRWMKTESPKFEKLFEEKTEGEGFK